MNCPISCISNGLKFLVSLDRIHLLFSYMQVMDMLGPSLWDVWNTSGQA